MAPSIAHDCAERGMSGGLVTAKVAEAVYRAEDRASKGVMRESVPDDLAAHTVLLCGEGESGEVDKGQLSQGAGESVDAAVADEELNVAKAEGVAFRRAAVFARPEQPEEPHVGEVTDSEAGGITGKNGELADVVKEAERERFYAVGWRVLLGVAAELPV